MEPRFEVIIEPSNFHMVWDRKLEKPAMFGDRLLGGMSEVEAKAACEIFNHFHQKRQRENAAQQVL